MDVAAAFLIGLVWVGAVDSLSFFRASSFSFFFNFSSLSCFLFFAAAITKSLFVFFSTYSKAYGSLVVDLGFFVVLAVDFGFGAVLEVDFGVFVVVEVVFGLLVAPVGLPRP